MKINIYNDPGHAWGKVSIKKLQQLNIAHLITNYSYMRKDYAYLEEDLDLSMLLKTLKDNNITYEFNEYYSNKSSKIRSYEHYSVRGTL